LREKGLTYKSHRLNLRNFEQHEPAYLALNPNGVVPTLIDNGQPIVESMLINEYIDEKYPDPPLRPDGALERARMRLWTKLADGYGPAAVVPHTWSTFKKETDRLTDEQLERALARVPLTERRARWSKAARGGFSDADREKAKDAARLIVTRMEAALRDGPWLMGEHYTLADIDLVPFVNRFESLYADLLNPTASPNVSAWLARMRIRPAVIAVFSTDESPYPTAV
jgi:glutathione S-transferase